MKQAYNITIDIEELLKVDDNNITDSETIRQIGLLTCTSNDISYEDRIKLCKKVNNNFQFCGLYPTTILPLNIKPELK